MDLQKDFIYHIYNQGNNRRQIFFNRDNYLFFVKKIKTYLCPYAEVLAWCLMPNHFHLMVLVKETELPVPRASQEMTLSHHLTSPGAVGKIMDEIMDEKSRTIVDSIAIMLRSYTRAINKQEGFTGSLFRKGTKTICINCQEGLSPSYYNTEFGIVINDFRMDQYPQICFNYIHQNPVKAGMVKKATDWEFSSARTYANLSEDILVNLSEARKYIDF